MHLHSRATASRAGAFLLLTIGILGLAASRVRAEDRPPAAPADVVRDGVTVQATRSMTLRFDAPADSLFPLFGPVREAEWSPDWKPVFVVPETPAQTPDGAVFTTSGATDETVWVMTSFDPTLRHIRYVTVRPGMVVTQLWIDVTAQTARTSLAVVTYRMTALGPEGMHTLTHFTTQFIHWPEHWQNAIGARLAHRSAAPHEP
jgi:hypothetical protein